MTIYSLSQIFKNQFNEPISDEDCELFKMFIEDEYKKIVAATNQYYEYYEHVIFSINLLKYDNGSGMQSQYEHAVLSLGALMAWCEKVCKNENKKRICEQ
jgi:hypothetical protein